MSKKLTVLILLLLSFELQAEPQVRVCDDVDGWAPYTIIGEDSKVEGIIPDLLAEIFSGSGLAHKVVLRHWRECLAQGEFDLVSNMDLSGDILDNFAVFGPVYKVHPGVFYLEESFSDPSLEEIRSQRVCGLRGNNYKAYMEERISVDSGFDNYESILKNLESGFCKFFAGTIELNISNISGLQYKRVGKSSKEFYFLIAEDLPFATEIMDLFKSRVFELRQAGAYEQLFVRHGLPGSGL